MRIPADAALEIIGAATGGTPLSSRSAASERLVSCGLWRLRQAPAAAARLVWCLFCRSHLRLSQTAALDSAAAWLWSWKQGSISLA